MVLCTKRCKEAKKLCKEDAQVEIGLKSFYVHVLLEHGKITVFFTLAVLNVDPAQNIMATFYIDNNAFNIQYLEQNKHKLADL